MSHQRSITINMLLFQSLHSDGSIKQQGRFVVDRDCQPRSVHPPLIIIDDVPPPLYHGHPVIRGDNGVNSKQRAEARNVKDYDRDRDDNKDDNKDDNDDLSPMTMNNGSLSLQHSDLDNFCCECKRCENALETAETVKQKFRTLTVELMARENAMVQKFKTEKMILATQVEQLKKENKALKSRLELEMALVQAILEMRNLHVSVLEEVD